jgi:hypothetical protein
MLLRCAASDFCVILRLEFAVGLRERFLGFHSSAFGSRIESGVVLSHFLTKYSNLNLGVERPVLLSEQAIKTLDRQSQLCFRQYRVMSVTCYMLLVCHKALSGTSIEV